MASLAEKWGTDLRPGGRRRAEGVDQLTLDRAKTLGRGGRRENAGRPRKPPESGRSKVAHTSRAEHKASTPVHVTLRRIDDLPSFRLAPLYDVIVGCIRDTQSDAFRIVHYSVQSNHFHLIVEAAKGRLERGLNGFAVRVARRLNANVLGRHGPLWDGRYHRHDLRTSPADRPCADSPVRPPETWLLRTGWTKVFPGYLLPSEAPKSLATKK